MSSCNNADYVFDDGGLSIWAGTGATLCSIMGATFNLITIMALLNDLSMRKHITTPFVISLATSDLLFSIIILPLMAARFFYG